MSAVGAQPKKRSNPDGRGQAAAKKRKAGEAAGIPSSLPWSANESAKTWELIAKLGKMENFKVLFGKKEKEDNTSGESKTAVFNRLGERIWPEFATIDKKTVGARTKNKFEGLKNTYRDHAKKLHQTGGGIGNDSDDEGMKEERMRFYISPGGPDKNTEPEARNLWEQIVQEFEFFPALHAIMATRPNVTPICITTGVGPHGSETIRIQAPSDDEGEAVMGSDSSHPFQFPEDFDFSQFGPDIAQGGFLADLGDVGLPIDHEGLFPVAGFEEELSQDLGQPDRRPPASNNHNSADKENTGNVKQAKAPGTLAAVRAKTPTAKGSRPPKASSVSWKAIANGKKSASQKRRQKATFEDHLLGSIRLNQKFNLASQRRQQNLEERKLLVDEVKAGLTTAEEAHLRIDAMRAQEQEAEEALNTVGGLGISENDSSNENSDSDSD